MMKKIVIGSILLATSLFAKNDVFYEKVKVSYSEPVYEYKFARETRQECKEVRYKIKDDRYDRYDKNSKYDDSVGVDTLVGTAAGVVIGSQIGDGNGRVAAQIVGGLLGARVANNIRNEKVQDDYYDGYRYETKIVCKDRKPNHHQRKERVLIGYNNYFVYNGVKHFKFSKRPLRKIKITHTINF